MEQRSNLYIKTVIIPYCHLRQCVFDEHFNSLSKSGKIAYSQGSPIFVNTFFLVHLKKI